MSKSKAILIIDMPSRCIECPLFVRKDIEGDYECKIKDYDGLPIYYKDGNVDRPNWCPLCEFPQKKSCSQLTQNDIDIYYEQGYNDCIDDILSCSNP